MFFIKNFILSSRHERWKLNRYYFMKNVFTFFIGLTLVGVGECLSTVVETSPMNLSAASSSSSSPSSTTTRTISTNKTRTSSQQLKFTPTISTTISPPLASIAPILKILRTPPPPILLSKPSNENELVIKPNFLIKENVPTINHNQNNYFSSSSGGRSSGSTSMNSGGSPYYPIKNNYTEFFISNKTKNYSKLIYQDINLDNLDDDFSDQHETENHLDNDNMDIFSELNNMYFGTENYTVITSQIGSTAMVPCSVHHIGEGVVTWIRRKDYHLLTVGLTTYSSDERFSTVHLKHSEDWTLQIKYVQLRDAGIYECQVSTHPPTSIFIQLNVVEARAEIIGPSEKYLKPGSTLRLACKVLSSTELPIYIFWYHNNKMINYDGGVNVTTESDNKYSELVIAHTTPAHSGNYSCVPNSAASASISVHILNGENPAAIQHVGHGNSIYSSPSTITTRSLLIAFFLLLKISL